MSKYACNAPSVWVMRQEDGRDGFVCAEHLHGAAAVLLSNGQKIIGLRARNGEDGSTVQPCGWSTNHREPIEYEAPVLMPLAAAQAMREGDARGSAGLMLKNASVSVAHQVGEMLLKHLAEGQPVDVVIKLRVR